MLGNYRLKAITVAAAAVAATAVAAPAEAATSTSRSVDGAYGSLTNIAWSSSVYEVSFMFTVRDTAKDGDHAEARVQTLNPNGQITSFSWHTAVGYGDETRFATYARTSSAIAAIRIQVCRKGDDLRDICEESPWVPQDF